MEILTFFAKFETIGALAVIGILVVVCFWVWLEVSWYDDDKEN